MSLGPIGVNRFRELAFQGGLTQLWLIREQVRNMPQNQTSSSERTLDRKMDCARVMFSAAWKS